VNPKLSSKQSREAFIFPFFDILLNGFNFIIILYINKALGENNFGIFTALIAFVSIAFIVGISFQTMTAKSFNENGELTVDLKKIIFFVLLVLNLLFLLLINWLRSYLRTTFLGLMIVLAMINLHTILSYERGKLQGSKQFKQLNISFYIEVLTRTFLTILLLEQKPNFENAVLAILLGMIVSLVHSFIVNFKTISVDHQTIQLHTKIKNLEKVSYILISNGCIYYLSNINILTVNHRLPQMSGIYGLSSKFSQLMLAVSMSLATILIPMASDIKTNEKELKHFVKKIILLIFILMTGIWVGYVTVLPFFLHLIYKNSTDILQNIIRIQSVAYIFFSMTQIIIMMEIVRERKRHILFLIMVSFLYTLIFNLIPAKISYLLVTEIIMHFGLFCILIIHFFERSRKDEKKNTISVMERHQA